MRKSLAIKMRILDIILSMLGLILAGPFMMLIFLICLAETGSPIFRQERVGKNQTSFTIFKFRTMHLETENLPTHLCNIRAVTPLGGILRRLKVDETPQLWNVLIGDMSLVGPRPNLPSQVDLIQARSKLGVYRVRPGITGLAQLRGVDMSEPSRLAIIDSVMIKNLSVRAYFVYLISTAFGRGWRDGLKRT